MFWKKQEEDGKGGKPFELNFEQIFFRGIVYFRQFENSGIYRNFETF